MSQKRYIAGDTGAGMFGKNLAMAAKHMGLKAKIFMGTVDIERQAINCKFMRDAGAEIIPVSSGSATLVDAVSECQRYYVANCDTTHLAVGSAIGANIFAKICVYSTSQISKELKSQVMEEFGEIPKMKLINVIGGGSSALGFWNEFIDYDKKHVELIGVEARGAAPLSNNGKLSILHGAAQYCLTDKDGQISTTHSLSAGLDYPGSSGMHGFLKDAGRARYTNASDKEALNAFKLVTQLEHIRPSLEPAHAFAECIRLAPKLKKEDVIIVNNCGISSKDEKIIRKEIGYYPS
jgi:tryptophan synthase beta subunit